MNRLQLIPLVQEDPQAPRTQRQLTIGVGDIADGCAVLSPRVIEQGLLSSVHVLKHEEELWETVIGRARLTRENPFLEDTALRHLDDDGLIREGTRVDVDGVLASIVVADSRSTVPGNVQPEKGMQWVEDRTCRVPSGWEGAVVASAQRIKREQLRRRAPRGLLERIEITLRAVRPLEVGDVLLVAEQPLVVASLMQQPLRDQQGAEADLAVPPSVAAELGISAARFRQCDVAKAEQRAADVLHARNVGPYSLISQQPLARPPYGGQPVTAAQVAWLADRGLTRLAGELASLKSDSVLDRKVLSSLVDAVAGSVLDIRTPGAPESLAKLRAYLVALGLNVDVRSDDAHVSIKLRPACADEIVQRSGGLVTKPDTLNYRTWQDMDDGLFAPNVFGPSNWSRRQRFGHVKLAVPIVSILWRIGAPSLLSRATGLGDAEIDRVVKYQSDVLLQNGKVTLIDRALDDGTPHQDNMGTGAAAVRAISSALSADGVLADFPRGEAWLTTDVLPVLPPDWRPQVLLDSGEFATSDLNDLYQQVINRNNRLAKLLQLNAPQAILDNEARTLQEAVDALFANSLLPESDAAFAGAERRLVDILDLALDKFARQVKRVDWSGAARLVPDASVPSDRVLVPRAIFDTLRLTERLPLLLTTPTAGGRFVARLPQPHNQLVLRVAPETYHQMSGAEPLASVAHVHRPVTEAGRTEAWRLLAEPTALAKTAGSDHADGWIESDSVAELARQLASAATSEEWTPFCSPRGLLLGGCGSVHFAADEEDAASDERRRQAPIPADVKPRFSEPTFDEMLAVARRHVQKTCVFDARRTDQAPLAKHGRIGGEPYLPAEVDWPRYRGKPLPFLGQFPLDPAREAGVLPIDVPPGSMLTVFGGDDCWEPGPCGQRCPVLIHASDNLVARPIPSDLEYPIGLCEITPRIVDETPDWTELQDILSCELRKPQPKRLQEFFNEYLAGLPATVEGIKIGGWPSWIQGADASEPLLLQLAAVEDTDLTFGDGGTLYVFVNHDGEFSCVMQCY